VFNTCQARPVPMQALPPRLQHHRILSDWHRHHQLAEGAPALLRHPAPGRRHRPQHRRRAPRARRGLHHPEVLRQFTRPPTSAPPWSSPLSSTATVRRNARVNCTVSISRPLGADSLAALASDAGPSRELEIFFNRTGLGGSQPFLTRAFPEWSVDGYRHLPRYVNGPQICSQTGP
jgi:hypothetical protein